MSIHILTTDPKLIQQLTELLEGGQQPFRFYNDLEDLISVMPKLKKVDKIFYDLQLEATLCAFDALRFGSKKTNLIAFELLKDSKEKSNCPKSAKHYFVLSPDLNKSGARLKQLLHEVDALNVKKKRTKKKVATKTTASSAAVASAPPPITLSRYLTAKSVAMQKLLVQIAELSKKPKFVFISGDDGADFELTAREINFRTNGDQSPLRIADPMRIEPDELLKSACTKDQTSYCYLGLSYELGTLSIERLANFFKQLNDAELKQPKLCFILGHVNDSDGYLEEAIKALIKTFRNAGEVIELPSMEERKEDVSLIAQSTFTTLRTAHPFLLTRTLSRSAIEYLEEQCADLTYSGIVRVIRNSMALCQRDTLTEDELKSFGDDSPTSQHLVESLADESYFADQSGAA